MDKSKNIVHVPRKGPPPGAVDLMKPIGHAKPKGTMQVKSGSQKAVQQTEQPTAKRKMEQAKQATKRT